MGVVQGQLAMRTAVLSPECIIVLMQVNMDQCHTQLESMLNDKSSNTTEHWQQVTVCHSFLRTLCLEASNSLVSIKSLSVSGDLLIAPYSTISLLCLLAQTTTKDLPENVMHMCLIELGSIGFVHDFLCS